MFIIKFTSLDEAKKCYGESNLIPITQLKQIIFYARMGCQPKFVWESEKEEGKIVAWYLKQETDYAYRKWSERRPIKDTI